MTTLEDRRDETWTRVNANFDLVVFYGNHGSSRRPLGYGGLSWTRMCTDLIEVWLESSLGVDRFLGLR